MEIRIGIGYDIHRLVPGREFFLGGVKIPYPAGLLGHSDGDALLHAVCDALLGALSLGDIGEHFPDSDPRYKGISSAELLAKVYALVRKHGFAVYNLDAIVIAEEPKLSPFKEKMQEGIASLLGIKSSMVSVKAKTNEGMGEVGRKEAVAAHAVALLRKEE